MVRVLGLVTVVLAGAAGTPGSPKAPKPVGAVSPRPSPSPTPVPTPSLEDSVAFLKEKLVTYGTYSFRVTATEDEKESGKIAASNTLGSFDKKECVLSITRKIEMETAVEGAEGGEYTETSTINLRIPLKEVEKKVKLTPYPETFRKVFAVEGADSLTQVEITAKGDLKPVGVREQRTMVIEGKTKRETNNDNIGSTYLVFADTDIAKRAADALEHAIAICQKKKEKF